MGIVIAIIGAAVLLGLSTAGIVCYRKFALPNMQPLSEQDLEVCREIVASGRGYPWICQRALKTGECPCFPCSKLLAERGLMLRR